MGHVGVSRKSPNDEPQESLTKKLSTPFSAPLLTTVWSHEIPLVALFVRVD